MADSPLLNEVVKITGRFTDDGGALADVTGLTLRVQEPDGVLVDYAGAAVLHDSLGLYHVLHTAAKLGTHVYRWTGAAPTSTVVLEGEFFVEESLFDSPEDWQPVTAGEVAAGSSVDFAALGLDPRRLQTAVEVALAWIAWATGRPIDSTLPDSLKALGREAVRQRVELAAYRASADNVQNAGTEGISSMSVGGLSISFRDPGAARSSGAAGVPALTPWRALNETLWALMTDERRDYWIGQFSGRDVPAFEVTEPDFSIVGDSSYGITTSDEPPLYEADWRGH